MDDQSETVGLWTVPFESLSLSRRLQGRCILSENHVMDRGWDPVDRTLARRSQESRGNLPLLLGKCHGSPYLTDGQPFVGPPEAPGGLEERVARSTLPRCPAPQEEN